MLGYSFRMSEKRIFCRKKWLINAKSRLGRHGRPIPHFTHLFFELQPVYNALYWHRLTRQLQCNVWQFNEAVGKMKHFGFGKSSLPGFRSPWLGPIPNFTHLFFELQPVCSTLHSIDIVRHVSFSAMCDNLMRLLGKNKVTILDLSFEVKYVGTNTRRFYSLIFWTTASV